MTTETKLRAGLVFSILTSLWLTVMWNNSIITVKEQKNKIDTLTNLSDSLAMENFPIQTELGRYEVALEIFKERNPKAASQFSDIISHETE
jgi:hypothetical protein